MRGSNSDLAAHRKRDGTTHETNAISSAFVERRDLLPRPMHSRMASACARAEGSLAVEPIDVMVSLLSSEAPPLCDIRARASSTELQNAHDVNVT